MARLRILLGSDHPHILWLLKTLLEPEYRVVGTAQDGRSLVAAALALQPHLVLTELDLPVLDGIAAVREIHRALPACRVVCHGPHGDPAVMAGVFEAGAMGFLIQSSVQSLVSTIRPVLHHVWAQNETLDDEPATPCRSAFPRM